MLPEERNEEIVVFATQTADRDHLTTYRDLALDDAEFAALGEQLRVRLRGPTKEDVHRFFALPLADGGATGRDDAGLLPGDLRNGVAQVLRVIHPYRGDHRDFRRCYRSGIPGAAHADFDHRYIDGRVGEGRVGQRRENLEVGHPHAAGFHRVLIDQVDVGL